MICPLSTCYCNTVTPFRCKVTLISTRLRKPLMKSTTRSAPSPRQGQNSPLPLRRSRGERRLWTPPAGVLNRPTLSSLGRESSAEAELTIVTALGASVQRSRLRRRWPMITEGCQTSTALCTCHWRPSKATSLARKWRQTCLETKSLCHWRRCARSCRMSLTTTRRYSRRTPMEAVAAFTHNLRFAAPAAPIMGTGEQAQAIQDSLVYPRPGRQKQRCRRRRRQCTGTRHGRIEYTVWRARDSRMVVGTISQETRVIQSAVDTETTSLFRSTPRSRGYDNLS